METARKITVVITVHNEEKNIAACIESARMLSEDIIVIDTQSTDKTVMIAKKQKVTIISFPYSKFVEPSRKFALTSAQGEWVFILDADERITVELRDEINEVAKKTDKTHFALPRKNIFAGRRWLKYGGWYPDYVLRLIKKDSFVEWPSQIHSYPKISGEKGFLKNPLVHLFHPSLENMVKKTSIFESIEAELLYKVKRESGVLIFFRKYFGELFRRLLLNFGFRDGSLGIIESIYQAYSKTITYIFLYEKTKKNSSL